MAGHTRTADQTRVKKTVQSDLAGVGGFASTEQVYMFVKQGLVNSALVKFLSNMGWSNASHRIVEF